MGKSRMDKMFDSLREAEFSGKIKEPKIKSRALRKMLNNRLAVFGMVVLAVILLCSIFAPLLTKYSPTAVDMKAIRRPPSWIALFKLPFGEFWKNLFAPQYWTHLCGTDSTGRDVFCRILYGGRMSILVGLGGALGAGIIGTLVGCWAGYKGGLFDKVAMRFSELFMAFPQLVLVLLLVTLVGQSTKNIIIIFVITGWGGVFRQARAKMLSLREEEYVQSLRAFGLGDLRICYKHMLPNAVGPIVVNLTLSTAMFILEEAALSYLGLGIPSIIPTWGNILTASQNIFTLMNNWWMWLPVGVVISLFVMSINFIGDGLRDSTDSAMQG